MTNMPHTPKYYAFFQNASPEAFEKARALRKSSTKAEDILWQEIRNRKLNRLKFRRQHSFEEFILDFYCPEKELVIEIDGGYHLTEEQKDYDQNRTGFIEEQGLRVVRFTNAEVKDNLEEVLTRIRELTK